MNNFVRKEDVCLTTIGHELRLLQQIYEMHIQWKLITHKLTDLYQNKIYETRREEKMRLEQMIEVSNSERQKVGQRLDGLEMELESYIENRIGRENVIALNNSDYRK